MAAILFDSSIYIQGLRSEKTEILSLRRSAQQAVWLSSIVLAELYAGVKPRDERFLEKLEYDFDRCGRILVPNLKDWAHTGKILARLVAKYDYELIGRTRITSDALIATSAARTGITVFTANQRDFARLAEFCPLSWRIWPGKVNASS